MVERMTILISKQETKMLTMLLVLLLWCENNGQKTIKTCRLDRETTILLWNAIAFCRVNIRGQFALTLSPDPDPHLTGNSSTPPSLNIQLHFPQKLDEVSVRQ